jgi:hypothetical protein
VRVAHEDSGLERGADREVHVEDARSFLRRSELFDVIEVDVFTGGPYAPFYCLTAEFFTAARARLAPTGLLSMNVYAPGADPTLAEAVVATLAKVFPTVLELQVEEERVPIAFREPTSLDAVRALLTSPARPGELQPVARKTAAAFRRSVPGGATKEDTEQGGRQAHDTSGPHPPHGRIARVGSTEAPSARSMATVYRLRRRW